MGEIPLMVFFDKFSFAGDNPKWKLEFNTGLGFASIIISMIPSMWPHLYIDHGWMRIGLPLLTITTIFLPSIAIYSWNSLKIGALRIRDYPKVFKLAQNQQTTNTIISKEVEAHFANSDTDKIVKIREVKVSQKIVYIEVEKSSGDQFKIGGEIWVFDQINGNNLGVFIVLDIYEGFVRAKEETIDEMWKGYRIENPDDSIPPAEIKCYYKEK